MKVFYADHQDVPLPKGHRFPMYKYRMLRETLLSTSTLSAHMLHASPTIDPAHVKLAHDAQYVDAFLAGELSHQEMKRIGLPWSTALVNRVMSAMSGTLLAARSALATGGISGNLAGGTHHAFRDAGEGFCVFNDLAIAIEVLREEGLISRATVIDLDVHQGNGTAAIFEHDQDVYTLSLHAERNYPFEKLSGTRDRALEDGITDDTFLDVLREELDAALAHGPDIVLYQAGVDALREDRLGRLSLTHEGLEARDELVLLACERRHIPVVLTLGGGYADPITPTIQAHVNTYRIARHIHPY